MKKPHRSPRRERHVARGRALAAVACALLLVLLSGERASYVAEREWSAVVPTVRPGTQERLRGDLDPGPPRAWSLSRAAPEPPAPDPRFDPRPLPALTPALALAARGGRSESPEPPEPPEPHDGRRADRPRVVNCPAQGPPRST
ncbi:hypothetical protein [Melittangium boletus]|uniref:Uncharacterized protein n=1 Tax=Melittangium boletus DSM 14713 TaxID=1294270 RepID=A0A250IHQ9_9BACT|nr:hypothetical protein [Melittangium boletus]ATB31354.1 hypothetical protein MEBOL_004816 [Melittangium boletus DSM 14713]